ncbi:MAG: hypothetical protein ACLGH4_03965 [Actinomycetes bacterium]
MSAGSDTSRGAAWFLTRVLLVPVVVVLVAVAYVVTAKALAVRDAGSVVTGTPRAVVEHRWKDSYSRRFPGCVPAVLWPAQRTPAAVIVQWQGRSVERVERGRPLRRALAANGPGTGRIIGACYR